MNALFTLRALLFTGELFAGSTVILALAWLAASQKAASQRHLVFAAAFGALLALPLLAAILPSPLHIVLTAPARIPIAYNLADIPADTAQPAPSSFALDAPTILFLLSALWLAGVVGIALRFAFGALCLAALKRRSRTYALAPEDEPRIAATRRECELRLCDAETGPVTWGMFDPVILLPRSALAWPRERLQAVLLHELAHIRRHDSLIQTLSQLACALYWPNPFVWVAAARLRREAEIAADDAVLVAGVKPSAYAGELLELASEFRMRQPAYASIPLFMASPSALKARVESVLSPTPSRSGVSFMDGLKIGAAGLLAASAIAFACPSLAQETAPAPAPIAQTTLQAPDVAPPADAGNQTGPADASAQAGPANSAGNQTRVADTDDQTRVADGQTNSQDAQTSAPEPAQIAQAPLPPPDAPPPPEAPAALPAIPATPAMQAIPATPALPAMPALPAAPALPADADASDSSVRIVVDGHDVVGRLSDTDRKRIRIEISNARRTAREAMAKARPEIEKAVIEERAGEKALRDAQPQIEAAMAEVAKAKPQMEAALAKVQPEIDAALAKVREEFAKEHMDVRIEERVDAALKRAEVRIEATQARIKEKESEHDERDEQDAPAEK